VPQDRLITTYNGELAIYAPSHEFIDQVKSRSDAQTIIYGHYGFGAHRLFDDPEPRYITFLRDPGRRILSFFAHQAREPQSRLYASIAKGLTLKNAITGHLAPEVNNYATRILSTDLTLVGALRAHPSSLQLAAGIWNGLGHGPSGPYDQVLHRVHHEIAVENLDRYFVFTGITERMHASTVRLSRIMGWNAPDRQAFLNAAPESHPDLDPETELAIFNYNALDIDLYKRCAQDWIEPF